MSSDGRQGARLKAENAEDLQVISALLQDATVRVGDIAWLPTKHRFACVTNRFKWEGAPETAGKLKGARVRAGLRFEGVTKASFKNVPIDEDGHILSVLAVEIESSADEDEPGAGPVTLTLECSGFATIRLEAEYIEVYLDDLSTPWRALETPDHGLGTPEQ